MKEHPRFEIPPDDKSGAGSVPEKEATPRPNTLDIVKINGRWAQTNGNMVKYLDDGCEVSIDWSSFNFVKDWAGHTVGLLMEQGQSFTPNEVAMVHWGPEQEEYPDLKKEVSVFGEYTSKK